MMKRPERMWRKGKRVGDVVVKRTGKKKGLPLSGACQCSRSFPAQTTLKLYTKKTIRRKIKSAQYPKSRYKTGISRIRIYKYIRFFTCLQTNFQQPQVTKSHIQRFFAQCSESLMMTITFAKQMPRRFLFDVICERRFSLRPAPSQENETYM